MTFLKSSGYVKDQASSPTTNSNAGGTDTTSGYAVRQASVSNSKEFHFVTDLHSGFLRCSRLLPPGK